MSFYKFGLSIQGIKYCFVFLNTSFIFLLSILTMAAVYRSERKITADENASVQHITRMTDRLVGCTLALFIGLPLKDEAWVTQWGADVSDLVRDSDDGGCSAMKWSLEGWVIDEGSLAKLRRENPGEARLVAPVAQ